MRARARHADTGENRWVVGGPNARPRGWASSVLHSSGDAKACIDRTANCPNQISLVRNNRAVSIGSGMSFSGVGSSTHDTAAV